MYKNNAFFPSQSLTTCRLFSVTGESTCEHEYRVHCEDLVRIDRIELFIVCVYSVRKPCGQVFIIYN